MARQTREHKHEKKDSEDTDFPDSPVFIHSGHFYSAPSSPLLLRGAPDYSTDTVSEFHAKAHRQLQVKDLSKVPTWWLVEPTPLRLTVIVSTKASQPTLFP